MNSDLSVEEARPGQQSGEEKAEHHGDRTEGNAQLTLIGAEEGPEASEEAAKSDEHHREPCDERQGTDDSPPETPLAPVDSCRPCSPAEIGEVARHQRKHTRRQERDQPGHHRNRECQE